MKKTFVICVMCLMALTMQAQRCAVLEFRAGVGISQHDVDGISEIFLTYFRPAGYTMVERSQINKVVDEQRFQRSNMTEIQMVRLGKILNVSKVVTGRINVVMGQYNVDVRVINVETGTIAATEGETFSPASYRTTMKSIAQKLASQIAITSGGTVQSRPSPMEEVYVDLGLPSGTKWKKNNEKGGFYTYDEAKNKYGNKLPTREQWEELKGMCTWQWTGKGYKVSGDNGKFIVLPAAGYRNCDGNVNYVGSSGLNWSSTPDGSEGAWNLYFDSSYVDMNCGDRCDGLSVRLVQ